MKRICSLLLVAFLGQSAMAQMAGWSYVQPILVHENSGATVTNYQLAITVNTADLVTAGEMLSTGDDIRFTSGCTGGTDYNYWIESGMNTASTKIWVKIDTLPANGSKTIYMQYGNSSATVVSAISGTFFGPHSATDSIAGGAAGGVTNSQRGIRFAANEDLLVTAFGKNEPNGSMRYVTLFKVSDQSIVYQTQVGGPAGQYSYGNIPTPLWLTQGAQYILEMYQGGSDGYYFGPSTSQIGQHLTYLDMRYCNGCDQNTYPQNFLNSIHYGYPDLWYYSKTNVTPAPTYEWDSYQIAPANDSIYVCIGDSVALTTAINGGATPYTISWTNVAVNDPSVISPMASPANSMTYYVNVTDACGVSKMDSIHVEVKPLPVFTVSAVPTLICNGESSTLTVVGNYTYAWEDGGTDLDTVVTPGSTTGYTVIATDVFMCQQEDSVMVTVNVPLTATHNVAICANESHTVGTHVYNTSGTYIDTLAGVTSCDSIVTTVLTIDALPEATHTVTICFGESLTVGNNTYSVAGTYIDTLSGFSSCDSIITTVLSIQEDIDAEIQQIGYYLVADVGGDGYQWIDCNTNTPLNGETSSSLEVTENGSYACTVTIGNCTKQSNCITINDVGINEPSALSSLSVYPNPTNGELKLLSGIQQDIFFLDSKGSVLQRVALPANETITLDISTYANGVYFIRHGNYITRLIVE